MREQLTQLIKQAHTDFLHRDDDTISIYEFIADRLIENGVILPLVRVGQTVWFIDGGYVKSGRKKTYEEYVNEGIVDNMVIGDKGTPQIEVCTALNEWIMHDLEDDFGKYLFTTREAAEAALKARENECTEE